MSDTPGISVELGEQADKPLQTPATAPSSETNQADTHAAPTANLMGSMALPETPADTNLADRQFEDDDELPGTPLVDAPIPTVLKASGGEGLDLNASRDDMEDEEDDAPAEQQKHRFQEDVFRVVDRADPNQLAMAIPTMGVEDIAGLLSVTAGIVGSLTKEQREALMVHGQSIGLTYDDDVYRNFFNNPDAKFVQVLRASDKTALCQTQPSFKEPKKGQLLDAAEASAYAARLVQAFDYLYIIAHHSGMWLKVQVPQGKALHNLQGRMSVVRNELGMATRGATLSNDTALRNMAFINWVIDHTMATNMIDSSPESIKRNLVALDIQLLAQQMASAIHPSGFMTERACSTKPGVCHHVERAMLRISKMQFIDSDRFTEKQLTHLQTLLRKAYKKSDADMASYRAEFGNTIIRTEELTPDISVTFQPPSVEVYEDTAEDWASGTRRESEETLTLMTDQEGRQHLEQQANLAVMTKYAAWVESINMQGRMVKDKAAILAVLATWSDTDYLVKKFTQAVSKYITDCTVAAVGVDDYKCPVCHGKQATAEQGLMASVAPMDAVTAFFTLAQLKIQQSLLNASAN